MKKVYATLLLTFLLPFSAFAAFNDVQMPSGTVLVLSIGGSDLQFTVNEGNVQDLTVNSGSVDFTLAPGSNVSISSSNRRNLDYSGLGRAQASVSCDSTSSSVSISLAGSESSDESVTVTPQTTTCVVPGTSGGGGGPEPAPTPAPAPTTTSVSAPAPATTATATTSATAVTQASAVTTILPSVTASSSAAPAISAVFTRDLFRGTRGEDVQRLQTLLAQDKAVYPDGLVTGFFGILTESAVKRFQAKYSLPQVGRVGPLTRQKLAAVFTKSASQTQATNQALQAQILELQKKVQELLKQLQAPKP